MTADQDVNAHLGGLDPAGNVLQYQFTPEALGRCTFDNDDGVGPYRTDFGHGPVVGSASTYDQVCANLRLQGSRHVDPFGEVATPKKAWLLLWYWMLDGCPTPLTRERRALYIEKAKALRAWPQEFKGAMPGEPTADYSTVNPDTPLDQAT
jgi:hypothetical protein